MVVVITLCCLANPAFLSLLIWVTYSENWRTGIGLCITSVSSTAAFWYNGMVVSPPLVNLSKYTEYSIQSNCLINVWILDSMPWVTTEWGLDFSIWSSCKWILQKVIWHYLTTIFFPSMQRHTFKFKNRDTFYRKATSWQPSTKLVIHA